MIDSSTTIFVVIIAIFLSLSILVLGPYIYKQIRKGVGREELVENSLELFQTNYIKDTFQPSCGNKTKIKKKKCTIEFLENCILQSHIYLLTSVSFYFEIKILELKNDSELLIGLAGKCEDKIDEHCILLKARNNGVIINKTEYPQAYVQTIKALDIVGIYYDNHSKELTFTYNGRDLLYYEYSGGGTILLPTIFSTQGTKISYNLGDNMYFYYRANELKIIGTSSYIKEAPPTYENNNDRII
ncbi:hypothetical protein K502DRAFT_361822 [Neoconidiobolus thromboides FSU 785]|nr:hypothetical protein K502DRAFT_361822 [Neoconidiobolus thromboides FSU 785]